jgi:hypothetical protein
LLLPPLLPPAPPPPAAVKSRSSASSSSVKRQAALTRSCLATYRLSSSSTDLVGFGAGQKYKMWKDKQLEETVETKVKGKVYDF